MQTNWPIDWLIDWLIVWGGGGGGLWAKSNMENDMNWVAKQLSSGKMKSDRSQIDIITGT